MTEAPQYTASGMAIRTAAILFFFVVFFTALLALAYQATEKAIAASATEEKMKKINEALPASVYDNALLADSLSLPPTPALGQKKPSLLYRAKKNGLPVAVVFEAIAPDGYAGGIRLLIALYTNGKVAGIRVIEHKETPGLGDYVDADKDRNKENPWINQFIEMRHADTDEADWKVKKDGGKLRYYAGATVSPRVVSRAIKKALAWAELNQATFFAENPH